jgi:glycogen(starch) synthase
LLVTMGPLPSDAQRRDAGAIAGLTLVESPYRLEWMEEPWSDVAEAGRMLRELERKFRPDVIHLNGYAHGAEPFSAPTLVVAHSCVLSWWEAVKAEPAPPRYRTYRERARRGLVRADMVVAPSHAMLAALQHHYGPLSHGRVLYNGFDPYGAPSAHKRPQIVAAGRVWDEAKNVALLARVTGSLPWPVYIAGASQAPEVQSSLSADALEGVHRLGQLPHRELCALLDQSAIYAAPARYEPFGLSILEAAASGCALVLGDIASLRELWSDAALFVAPDDERALRTALQTLIDDAPLRHELAARAALRARQFSRAAFVTGYQQLYQSLASQGRVAPRGAAELSCSST